MKTKRVAVGLILVGMFWASVSSTLGAYNQFGCEICGKAFGEVIYQVKDEVTKQKRGVCWKCAYELPRCYICSLPTLTNLTGSVQFEDERVLCVRDAKSAVLEESEGVRIYGEVRDQVERQFWRFMSMPGEQVKFGTIDRVDLESLFQVVGKDYKCPEVMGITMVGTNQGRLEYEISVLIGLPRGRFRAVCAHEIAHTWQMSNLTEERRKKLSHSAREGFCELVAFLCVDSAQDQVAKEQILENKYTRGQIDLFVEAEHSYGFNDVVDWMRWGVDEQLKKDDPLRVRAVEVPKAAKAEAAQTVAYTVAAPAPARVYETVKLKGIMWDARQPTALLNDRVMGPGEEVTLRVSGTNVTVRCLEIKKDAVRVQFVESCEEKVLSLGEGRPSEPSALRVKSN